MSTESRARDVMVTDLVTVGPHTPLEEVIGLLMRHRISGVPVVDGERRLLGIVTEKDLLRLLYETAGAYTTAGALMTTGLRTFQADDPLEQVCDCLMANHFRRVPVLEGERLAGLISRADLMPTILEVTLERTRAARG